MNRYLVCCTVVLNATRNIQAKVYPISKETEIEDLTYPRNTLAFFIVNTNESKEQIQNKVGELFTKNNNTSYIAVNIVGFEIEEKTTAVIKIKTAAFLIILPIIPDTKNRTLYLQS